MDYNIDRQFVNIQRGIPKYERNSNSLGKIVTDTEDLGDDARIIIQAIGKF